MRSGDCWQSMRSDALARAQVCDVVPPLPAVFKSRAFDQNAPKQRADILTEESELCSPIYGRLLFSSYM